MHYRVPIILLALASIVWIAGSSYCYLCQQRGHCDSMDKEAQITDESEVKSMNLDIAPFSISDGELFHTISTGNLIFRYATDSLIIESGLKSALDSLANYLKENPAKRLVVTGKYSDKEGGAELGNSRARQFIRFFSRDYLVDSTRFNFLFTKDNNLPIDTIENLTYNALSFDFNTDKSKLKGEENEEKLELLKDDLSKARTVYFDFGSSLMKSDPALHQFFSDLKFYTDKVKGAKVSLIGHADNKGTDQRNMALSLARAKDVKNYLIENHNLNSGAFAVQGKGEEQPVASNDTDEGRAKNRRVEIMLSTK
jgi:outer membrane protein OmpA-like peptidoglycan-associated protein